MNLNNMIQISSPTKIAIITRLRGANLKNIKEKNKSNFEDNHQYTIFTKNNRIPSDILYISERPIEYKKIGEILNSKNQNNNLNYLNFKQIYPQLISLDLIYQQILQNPINDLFYKKNSCMFFFGPTMGGKSYLLRGSPFKDEKESGLLTRAITEVFQRLQFNNNFCVKISVYQIYLDKIYDLLSNDNNMELNFEANYSEINNSCNINILGLNKKEIKNSDEYDLTLREAINNRRKLSGILGINDIKKKSTFIVSIFLENKIESSDNKNIEYMPFSQFDFVELISSNFGLLNENEDENNNIVDKNLFDNTNHIFNSIADNIIKLSQNSYTDNDSLLTLTLKNTLKPNSNIIFMNCVIPWEFPLKDSFISLKFTNMIFSQINKNENYSENIKNINKSSSNNLNFSLDYSENHNTNAHTYNNIYQNMDAKNLINNIDNSGYEKMNEYLSSLTIDKIDYLFPEKEFSKKSIIKEERDYKEEINEENNLYTKYNYNNKNGNKNPLKKNILAKKNRKEMKNKSFDSYKNNINKKIPKKKNNNNNNAKKQNISLDKRNISAISAKEKKLQKLNETLKELEAKSNELNQNSLEPEYLYNYNKSEGNLMNNINNKILINDEKDKEISTTIPYSNTNLQYEKIKEEYGDLKSNNIILKEDIGRLEQANKNLELALTEQRNRNIEILNRNEELSYQIVKLEELLDEANIRDEKFKINEINIEKLLNEKLFLNSKINEDEKNYKKLKEEKEKFEVEYRVLNEKYIELKNNYDIINNEYNNIKLINDEKFNNIEDKVDNLLKEIEKLQSENNILRNENERHRIDLNQISNQRDDYKEKFNEQKNKNDLLCIKINEIEKEFNDLKREKMNEEYNKLKYEENKKNKNENKIRIVNELQNRIQKYREQRLKQEMNED